MLQRGIAVDRIYFSGFSSQGDGASFSGYIDDFCLFWNAHSMEVPTLRAFVEADEVFFRFLCSTTSGSCHSGTMAFDDSIGFTRPECEHPLEEAAMCIKEAIAETEWEAFANNAEKLLRDYADELYRALETEYDYLTSNAVVLDLLTENNLLEQELEPYRSSSAEESDEGQDTAPVQEFLLRPLGAVSEAERTPGHSDACDGREVRLLQPEVHSLHL